MKEPTGTVLKSSEPVAVLDMLEGHLTTKPSGGQETDRRAAVLELFAEGFGSHAVGSALLTDISASDEWSWANNDKVKKEIEGTKEELESHMDSDPIIQAAVAGEPAATLRTMPGFDNRIKALASMTEDKVTPLREIVQKMRKMQQIHMK